MRVVFTGTGSALPLAKELAARRHAPGISPPAPDRFPAILPNYPFPAVSKENNEIRFCSSIRKLKQDGSFIDSIFKQLPCRS